jgi:ATP-dependent helicase/DNAse subunit B
MSINNYITQIIDDNNLDKNIILKKFAIPDEKNKSKSITIKSLIQFSEYIAIIKNEWTEDILLEILYHDDDLMNAIKRDKKRV